MALYTSSFTYLHTDVKLIDQASPLAASGRCTAEEGLSSGFPKDELSMNGDFDRKYSPLICWSALSTDRRAGAYQ